MRANSAEDRGIVLQITDAPLKDVVMLLTQQSGMNIIIADDASIDRKVTAYLNNIPLEKALDYVVKSAGASYRKMDDGTFIISSSLPNAPVISANEALPNLAPVAPIVNEITNKNTEITKIQLVHSTPSDILRLLGWNLQTGRSYKPARSQFNEENPRSNSTSGYRKIQNRDNNLFMVGPDAENRFAPVIPTIDPSGRPMGSGRTASEYEGAAQIPGGGGAFPGAGGFVPGGATGIPGQQPQQQQTTTQQSTLSGDFLMPEGVDDIRPFDLDNSLIVKGTPDGIEALKKVVRMLDIPPKQVQIKAEFVEVTTNDVNRFGIDWSMSRLNETVRTALGGSDAGTIALGLRTGNLSVQMAATLTRNFGTVINAPIISTLNNMPAEIYIDQTYPIWIPYSVVNETQVRTEYRPEILPISTGLTVLPRVNGDGSITMQLQPQVSDVGNLVEGPDGTTYPETREQTLTTTRRVANGETMVVGGFIRRNDSTDVSKVPILGDLPIIGGLFRSTSKTRVDRELLIFITPTIIPDSTGSASNPGGLMP
ncbi:MAG: hypothetical protein SNJ70_04080 [Armatimonadota bacterium]